MPCSLVSTAPIVVCSWSVQAESCLDKAGAEASCRMRFFVSLDPLGTFFRRRADGELGSAAFVVDVGCRRIPQSRRVSAGPCPVRLGDSSACGNGCSDTSVSRTKGLPASSTVGERAVLEVCATRQSLTVVRPDLGRRLFTFSGSCTCEDWGKRPVGSVTDKH